MFFMITSQGHRVAYLKKYQDLGISAPQILEFDVALGHFDVAWPKLWHKNGVFDQILGCSGHFDVALEKWASVALKHSTGMQAIFCKEVSLCLKQVFSLWHK